MILEWLKALLYGVLEGVTEWLPISSTGHLILLEELLPFAFSRDNVLLAEFGEMFDVVIQLGAILAVIVLFWQRLFPFSKHQTTTQRRSVRTLWLHLLLASLPAALIGVLGDKLLAHWSGRDLDAWCYNAPTVALMLILYGVAFLLVERMRRNRLPTIHTTDEISHRTTLLIGCFQALSIIPGTSRSGATILGAMTLGLSRTAAAEFSFFLAIPAMVGASAIKLHGFFDYLSRSGVTLPPDAWILLLLGCVTSFLVSLVAIRFLTDFVKRHSFAPFGIYRIALGTVVLLWWCIK